MKTSMVLIIFIEISLKNRSPTLSKTDELEFDVTVLEPLQPKHLQGNWKIESTSNNRLPYTNPRLAYFSSFLFISFFLLLLLQHSILPTRNNTFTTARIHNFEFGSRVKRIDAHKPIDVYDSKWKSEARNLRSVISDTVFAFQVMWI